MIKSPSFNQPWVEAIVWMAKHYDLPASKAELQALVNWSEDEVPTLDTLRLMARRTRLSCERIEIAHWRPSPWRLPVIIVLQDDSLVMVEAMSQEGQLSVRIPGESQPQTQWHWDELLAQSKYVYIFRALAKVPDARVDDYLKPYQPHWLLGILFNDKKTYVHIVIASLFANILALAGIIFTRQVYDRVVPSESYVTLYVLFSGVLVAVVFEYFLRVMRIRISDLVGKRADLRISDLIFGRALRAKSSAAPKSSGAFVAQIRDLESVREMLTSSTVMLIADLPFFFLFLVVFWSMAGVLTVVPVVAVVLMVLPSLLAQPKLARLSKESMRESTLRNAMLVESIQGLEDIKVLQAEQRFQKQWNHYNQVSAEVGLRLRYLTNSLQVWSNTIQSLVFASIVLFGAPMVMNSELSVGTLVAASILSSRMIAPMGQLTQLLNRWQQAKTGYKSLDKIMSLPADNPVDSHLVHHPALTGHYQLDNAVFSYAEDAVPALTVPRFEIKPGDTLAILGRNGAGKSTLLHALAGLLEPVSGEVLLENINLAHLDKQDLRRDVGFLGQHSKLFYGSLRDNICIGAPYATDEAIARALEMSGATTFIQRLPKGLDHVIFEGGGGLSGGQKQSLLLARLFLRDPQIVLLDEPTSALDDVTEQHVLRHLKDWLAQRTLVVVTHKQKLLELVDRVVVIANGRISLDASKEDALKRLAGGK